MNIHSIFFFKNAAQVLYKKYVAEAIEQQIADFKEFSEKYFSQFKAEGILTSLSESEREKIFEKSAAPLKKELEKNQKNNEEANKKAFSQLLKETKEIRWDSSFKSVEKYLKKDSRFHLLKSEATKEKLFNEFVYKLKSDRNATGLPSGASNSSVQSNTIARAQRNHIVKDLETNLNALYVEFVKSHKTTWAEALHRLEDMPRFQVKEISMGRKKELFHMHIDSLKTALQKEFTELLKQSPEVGLGTNWEDVDKKLEKDVRYLILDEADRKVTFNHFQSSMLADAKKVFASFLRDALKTITLSKSGTQFERALDLLKTDPRWRALDKFPDERQQLIIEYTNS